MGMGVMTPRPKPRRAGVWKAWCGFIKGRPNMTLGAGVGIKDIFGSGLYQNRKAAKTGYWDVRRVAITEIVKPRQGRGK